MKKRGQATLFVIIGFFLLLALSLGYYTLNVKQTGIVAQSQETPATQTTLPVKYLVDKCLSLITKQGVTLLGKKGGYVTSRPEKLTPDMIRLTEKEELAYFYLRHGSNFRPLTPKESIPTIDYMQKELERYVKNELRECLDDFEFFVTKGIEVKMEKMAVNATISPRAVTVDLHFPVTLQTEEKTIQVKDFTTSLPVRLGEIRDVAEKIVKETKRFEQELQNEIRRKIRNCDEQLKIETQPHFDQILPFCNPNPALGTAPRHCIIRHESDCETEVGFCAVLAVKVTVHYKQPPLFDCKTVTTEEHRLLPLIHVYGILDYDAPQDPFTFLFMTKMNLDTEDTCNKC